MGFNSFSITKKLSLGFGSILAVITVSSVFLVSEVRHVVSLEQKASQAEQAIDLFDQAMTHLTAARAAICRFVISGFPEDHNRIAPELEGFEQSTSAVQALIKEQPAILDSLSKYKIASKAYVENALQKEATFASDSATRPQAVQMITSPTNHYGAEATSASKVTRAKIADWADSWIERGNTALSQILWVTIGSGLVSLLLGLMMMRAISRSISRPVDGMAQAMEHLAGGDLAVTVPALGEGHEIGRMASAVQVFKENALEKRRLETEGAEKARAVETERAQNEAQKTTATAEQARVVATIADGLAQLAQGKLSHKIETAFPANYERLRVDFNGATEKLLSTMVVVSQNTSAISNGTKEIATASDDLSLRTEQQAASLEETAAALAQLTDMVNKTSFGAREARELVMAAQTQAENSAEVVGRAVGAIHDISQSSTQIGQIIGVIDEIAFQTNLLALNAGVEAARAGESGRGFAVVASEVRALAQRSAEAAKEIKSLITASSGLVEQGVDLVGRTGQALSEIKTSVSRITKVVGDISEAAREQATGLAEINKAISQMDKVTQQNAAMVEESTAATHSLAGETADLVTVIQGFDLGANRRNSAPVVLAAKRKEQMTRPAPSAVKKVVNASYAPRTSTSDNEDWTEF